MKKVSWDFAFLKLKEWQEKRVAVAYGVGEGIDVEDEPAPVFAPETTRITNIDPVTGKVTLENWNPFSLRGASFKYSSFEDARVFDLKPSLFESQLEATFPDRNVLVFARKWEV